jgi:hypothetical protein
LLCSDGIFGLGATTTFFNRQMMMTRAELTKASDAY